LEMSKEKTKYMFMSCHQNSEQNHIIKIANKALKKWQGSDTWERQ